MMKMQITDYKRMLRKNHEDTICGGQTYWDRWDRRIQGEKYWGQYHYMLEGSMTYCCWRISNIKLRIGCYAIIIYKECDD